MRGLHDGVAVGLILFPLLGFPLVRALPFTTWRDSLATAALGEEPWRAGLGLMERGSPGEWNALMEGLRWVAAAGDELKGCYEAAKKAGKEQRCSITMKPPR
jgi:uncharacterized protein DUF6118